MLAVVPGKPAVQFRYMIWPPSRSGRRRHMDRGRRAIPIANRSTFERERAYLDELHRNRLRRMRSVLDTSQPSSYRMPHLLRNPKRALQEAELRAKTEVDNRYFQERIEAAARAKVRCVGRTRAFAPHRPRRPRAPPPRKPLQGSATAARHLGSLNLDARRREFTRMVVENRVRPEAVDRR